MSDLNEEIVDRVLARIGKAEVPEHLEQRVLAAMRSRSEAKPRLERPRWRFASLTVGVALAGVAYTVFIGTHRSPSFPRAPQRVATTAPVRDPLQPKALARPVIVARTPAASRAPKPASPDVLLARNQLAAVSFPAPPMPLTDQEKLLLRLAHKGDPVQLAMLDPIQRNAWYAAERADVQRFFTPSPSGENK